MLAHLVHHSLTQVTPRILSQKLVLDGISYPGKASLAWLLGWQETGEVAR